MKVCFVTIVIDGMPTITWHLPIFNQLKLNWRWIIVEGAAMNVKDTSWCKPQEPRLSRDGTTEYLNEISRHPRVRVIRRERWEGKVEQFNTALSIIPNTCLLWEVDADELWSPGVIESVANFFDKEPNYNCATFYCRFFLGQNIIATGRDCYGANPGEWKRVFRFHPGMTFERHEPPVLKMGVPERCLNRDETLSYGWTFDHWAYAFESQLRFKEKFYGYKDALAHWKRLQQNTAWPVKRLQEFLPWTDDRAGADLLCR